MVSSEDDSLVPEGGIEPLAGLSSHAAKAAAAARREFPAVARGDVPELAAVERDSVLV